jgi:signal transduction histidine kinase/CheY-like chemotaxis protein
MKIRTRAFLLGLIPTLLVAAVLTGYHLHTRIKELERTLTQQGMTLARHLASSAEYGVISGNRQALENLLDHAVTEEPGVKTAMVVWPDQTRLERGEPAGRLQPLHRLAQQQIGERSWFVHPVNLSPSIGEDPFLEPSASTPPPLAWVAVSIDLAQKRELIQQLLLASLGITFLGLMLAILLIHQLALTGLQPLLAIIAAVKRISSGHFGTQLDVTARSPELRELQAMVNQMSDSLLSFQHDMEAKVQAVTAELEHKKKEAEQANLAKSKFLAVASHDLRQPMHAISLYVESLKSQMHGRAAKDTLDKIERSILGMVELFNAILDVTKLEAGAIQPQLTPIRIRKFFLQLADEFAAEADRKRLSLRVHAPDVWIESDEMLLERIFRNLLSNALRHTSRGGVLLSARRHKGLLRLQVWDTGSGIAHQDQPRVFEEFYQAGHRETEPRHGLGLGLAIVHRLARLLGYPLQLHSTPGRGTVFSLDAPVVAQPSAYIDEPAEEGSEALKGDVVVVDDEPAVLDALGRLLQQWGLRVHPMQNLFQVKHGLAVAPDVMLLDYQLHHGETGLMAAQEIRQRWGADIPIVLITGDTRAETVQTLNSLGHPVLYKPIQPAQLRSLLGKILAQRTPGNAANAPDAGPPALSPSVEALDAGSLES